MLLEKNPIQAYEKTIRTSIPWVRTQNLKACRAWNNDVQCTQASLHYLNKIVWNTLTLSLFSLKYNIRIWPNYGNK